MNRALRSVMTRIVLLCLTLFAAPVFAQDSAYTEGAVVEVSSIKVVDGQFENYLAYLQKNWKGVMEEAKKAGYVLDYGVYRNDAHSPQEPDLYLVVTYPNMATLDGMQAKMAPIMKKVTNLSVKEADEASGKRVVMRELLGSELLRELKLK